MKFADRLKARRKKLGLSADEIADKIGKNQATIHRYESGDIENIPINVVVPLAKVLMTTPDWLMGWDEEEVYTMTVGERIKKARDSKNLSQTELAKLVNISKQTLYKYENNIITNIPSDKIELIAEVLKVSPAFLMGWDKEVEIFQEKLDADHNWLDKYLRERFSNPDTKPVDTVVKTTLKLKTLREENKKTMAQVARNLGIPYTTYVNYEKGEREPDFNTLISLAKYFNCSIDNLFGRGKQENPHEAVLKAVESVLNEYLSDALTASVMEEISKKINKSG